MAANEASVVLWRRWHLMHSFRIQKYLRWLLRLDSMHLVYGGVGRCILIVRIVLDSDDLADDDLADPL